MICAIGCINHNIIRIEKEVNCIFYENSFFRKEWIVQHKPFVHPAERPFGVGGLVSAVIISGDFCRDWHPLREAG